MVLWVFIAPLPTSHDISRHGDDVIRYRLAPRKSEVPHYAWSGTTGESVPQPLPLVVRWWFLNLEALHGAILVQRGICVSEDATTQQTQNICITFIQCWTNDEDVGPTLYKCYTDVLCLLGSSLKIVFTRFACVTVTSLASHIGVKRKQENICWKQTKIS